MSQSTDPVPPDDFKSPTREQLAGVYILVEGEEKVTDAARRAPATPPAKPSQPPSTDELAGIYIAIDEQEKSGPPPRPENP